MLYQFRTDRKNRDTLLDRLKADQHLCQGWGGGDAADLSLDAPDFASRVKKHYDLKTTRIPSNLKRIRSFKDGDLLIVPHLPRKGRVSIHVVDGDFPACYEYVPNDPSHLNHRIRVRSSVGLDREVSTGNSRLLAWRSKLQWRRLPVHAIPQYEEDVKAVRLDLVGDPSLELGTSDLDEFFESLRSELVEHVRNRLYDVVPAGGAISFEGVCEQLLVNAGYQVSGRNQYDGEGGDIDRRCERARSDVTPFETGDTLLFVQIKKHRKTTGVEAVNQVLQMIEKEPADGCVMSLGDDFSEEAEAAAADGTIALLNGPAISEMLLRYIVERGGEPPTSE